MKTSRAMRILLAGAACCLAYPIAVLLTGCDTEPVDEFAVTISPQSVTLKKGESQVFTASGGLLYAWASSTNSEVTTNASTSTAFDPWALLSATSGEQITYTSLRSPTEGSEYVVQTLTVIGTLGIGPSTSTDTNQTSTIERNTLRASATAYIYHVP